MRLMIITLMLLWGCTKADMCSITDYPKPPFGDPDIIEIRKEKYYVKLTYIYWCINDKHVTVIYTYHEDICWEEDINVIQNELCN